MTRISNKNPALRRAQKWLAEHGDPLPEPGARPRQPAKTKSRAAGHQPPATSSRSGPRTGIPVRDSCVPDEFAGRDSRAVPGHSPLDLSRHERRCTICRHPERDAIEEAFLHWRPASQITFEFKLPDRTTVYRHAHALNLFPRRSRNLRFALGLLIERAEGVTATAEGIVSAVRAYTRLTDAGEWIEPPAHVIVSSGSALLNSRPSRLAPDVPAHHESPITSHESQVLIPTHAETENDATP